MGLLLASTSACRPALHHPPVRSAPARSTGSCPVAQSPPGPLGRLLSGLSIRPPPARPSVLAWRQLLLLVSAVDFVPGERLKTMPQNQERIKRDERKKKERM